MSFLSGTHDTLYATMIGNGKIRSWKALALFTAVVALVLLLLPHAANHHAAAIFLLVPIFLFGLLDTLAPQHPAVRTIILPYQNPTRPALFQRPPPALA